MNCCFLCSPIKPLNSARSEVNSSMADYLQKEKLCQEICKTITASVESTDNTPLNVPNLALLPELNTDDIEGILHQISALLTPRSGDNSQLSDLEGLNESRSVEDILKEAESLVRASTPYFERRSSISGSSSSWSPIPKLGVARKLRKLEKFEKQLGGILKNNESMTNGENQTPALPSTVVNPPTPSLDLPDDSSSALNPGGRQEEHNPIWIIDNAVHTPLTQVCITTAPVGSGTSEIIKHCNDESNCEDDAAATNNLEIETREVNVSEEEEKNKKEFVEETDNKTEENKKKLSLSDLMTPPVNCTYTVNKSRSVENMPRISTIEGLKAQMMSESDMKKLQTVYEEKLFDLQKKIVLLNSKLAVYEQEREANKRNCNSTDQERLKLLEEEIRNKEQLIRDYQRENQRLTNQVISSKNTWKETELKLVEQIRRVEQQLKATVEMNNKEVYMLRHKLKDAQENIVRLELQINSHKNDNKELECTNEELTVDVTRLRCEIEEYKKEIQDWTKKERERLSIVENNAVLQAKLSQANTEVTRKQTEIVRLNGEVGKLRGELERIRLGSVVNTQPSSEVLNITVSQLQSALNMERENIKQISKANESVAKENLDLKRQVKELETIVKRRVKCGNSLAFGQEPPMSFSSLPHHDVKLRESLEHNNRQLQHQLELHKAQLVNSQQKIKELQDKYNQDMIKLEQQLKIVRDENSTLKQSVEDHGQTPRCGRTGRVKTHSGSSSGSSNAASVKEDAHLLATIRGLKLELTTRDKELLRLNKELEDTKKTNRRLQKEREKALTANKTRGGNNNKDFDKPNAICSSAESGGGSVKNYNPALFEDDQETLLFLRTENKNLRDEIKRLEQDLISLHNKRIQDLSDIQQEHDGEVARLLREHALKHSSSTVAHLQGQLYTQQMVINHLKQQLKVLEESSEEIPVLKAERDQLESTLMEANKKIARLHDLASPESVQYSGLLEKLEFLERRHEVREQKLQSIVRDLLTRQQGGGAGQDGVCGSTCRDKLINKNREICYYRAEMDRILDTLAEFRWGK